MEAARADPTGRPEEGTASGTGCGAPEARTAVTDALSLVATLTGASRVVVWRLEPSAGTLDPIAATGVAPASRPAAADPLTWCIANAQPLRVDRRPAWAEQDVVAVPADAARSLAVTFEGAMPTGAGKAEPGDPADRGGEVASGRETAAVGVPRELVVAARLLGRMAAADAREAAVAADLERVQLVLGLMQRIPGDDAPGGFAEALARVAQRVLEARVAVIASWNEDAQAGEVLASSSPGEGPPPEMPFRADTGLLGLAARSGAAMQREGEGAAGATLAGESAPAHPSCVVAVPLAFAGHVQAVVGAWSDAAPSRTGVQLLQALGPVLTVQLHQAADLDRFRLRATEDPLTRLPNRGALEERLELERQRFFRYRRPLAALILDLDHFKGVNDTHGHAAGDAVLRAVADRLRATIRDVDFPARVGGEELVVLLPETMLGHAGEVAERVRAAVARTPVWFEGTAIAVTASVGVSACPECVDTPDALLDSADHALYVSKAGGRNRVTLAGAGAAAGQGPGG